MGVDKLNKVQISKVENFGKKDKMLLLKTNVTEFEFELVLRRIENIVGKGDSASYQHFFLFPQCFQKLPHSPNLGDLESFMSFFKKQVKIDHKYTDIMIV